MATSPAGSYPQPGQERQITYPSRTGRSSDHDIREVRQDRTAPAHGCPACTRSDRDTRNYQRPPTHLSLGRAARSSRGRSLVLPPRPGWRDLAGRCWHARPQPQALRQPTRLQSRPRPATFLHGRLRWLHRLPLVVSRHATVSTVPRFQGQGRPSDQAPDAEHDDPDGPSRRWPDADP